MQLSAFPDESPAFVNWGDDHDVLSDATRNSSCFAMKSWVELPVVLRRLSAAMLFGNSNWSWRRADLAVNPNYPPWFCTQRFCSVEDDNLTGSSDPLSKCWPESRLARERRLYWGRKSRLLCHSLWWNRGSLRRRGQTTSPVESMMGMSTVLRWRVTGAEDSRHICLWCLIWLPQDRISRLCSQWEWIPSLDTVKPLIYIDFPSSGSGVMVISRFSYLQFI
jgi:hypothetical protein